PPGAALERAAPPQERPVHAAAVDHEPVRTVALEREVRGAGDEQLGIGLERDVVGLGQPADGDPRARQGDAAEEHAVRPGDDDLRSTIFHRSPISSPWIRAVRWSTLGDEQGYNSERRSHAQIRLP